MFAVMKTGGKQYKVASGDILRVEKLAAEAGETVQFNDILMIGDAIGAPTVEGAAVQAEVIDQIKGEKTINFVRRRRKHSSKRTKGHRQQLTLVKVTELLTSGADKSGVKAAIGAAIASAMAHNGEASASVSASAAPKKASAKKASAEAAPAKKADSKPAATGGADDLKELSGVGPALEKKLHENGVTTFAQIAAWTDADVAEMDEKLSFKGRIEREGWIEQAKKLAN
ncbi:50S ribosomal protein L21 [Flavimaricola marinus]|uniref:Large ribosomal subunit protein bL21 n=1 Tax=Flavimaricola marinus TaxID=1819565 RepID=A0A238LCH1_9RHOB|nr:50S ribosomal protein L21 [Flavimaricola marinus]SMY07328.1 50S ribosomal protein L21 [Flavimaricola marinus]